MSAYVSFYLKTKDNAFIGIGSFSRSHEMYSVCEYLVPYEKIKEIDFLTMKSLEDNIVDLSSSCKEDKKNYKKKIDFISTFNNSAEEKIEAISTFIECVNQLNKIIDNLKYCGTFLNFIENMTYENEGSKLYFGVECYEPTVEDIEA